MRLSPLAVLLPATLLQGCMLAFTADVGVGGGQAALETRPVVEPGKTPDDPQRIGTQHDFGTTRADLGVVLHSVIPVAVGLRGEAWGDLLLGKTDELPGSNGGAAAFTDVFVGDFSDYDTWLLRGSYGSAGVDVGHSYEIGLMRVLGDPKSSKFKGDYWPIPHVTHGTYVELWASRLEVPISNQFRDGVQERTQSFGLKVGFFTDFGPCLYYFLCMK